MHRRHASCPPVHRDRGGCGPGRHRGDRPRGCGAQGQGAPATTINGSGATFPQGIHRRLPRDLPGGPAQPHGELPEPGWRLGQGPPGVRRPGDRSGALPTLRTRRPTSRRSRAAPFLYVPYVTAPITVSYNLSDVSKRLKFTPATIAKIFQGDITSWDDAAIAADNPGVKLPVDEDHHRPPVRRSGTTENFTKYLTKAAGSVWTLGSGSTVTWPEGSQGGNGNSGVSSIVDTTDGADRLRRLLRRQGDRARPSAAVQNALGQVRRPEPAGRDRGARGCGPRPPTVCTTR